MTDRPTPRRLVALALAGGFALVSMAGLTGCGASRGSEAPAVYAPRPADEPTGVVVHTKRGPQYAAVQFKQGE